MRRMLSRVTVVAALATLGSMIVVPQAGAVELDDYLRKADEAGYSGRQIVITLWDGIARAGIFEVEQAGGMLMLDRGNDDALVRSGRLATEARDGIAIPTWSRPNLSDRYVMAAPERIERVGRPAESIDVFEDGRLRARYVFDLDTYAPLATEVYDGNGDVFRYSAMIDFGPTMRRLPDVMSKDDGQYDVMLPVDDVDLPAEAAGYVRADAYVAPDDAVQAFYTDGLFSFSVFVLEGRADVAGFDEAMTKNLAGRDYEVLVTPSDVWVQWERGGTSYVLVGDLPPDHLEEVLTTLPSPASRNFLQRVWRGLFG